MKKQINGDDNNMQKILNGLITEWEHHARRGFHAAKSEEDPMGKKLIEHGAMCYFNCSRGLRGALGLLPPESSTTQGECQK